MWRSFYRAFVLHGTHHSTLSRNVAYDIIGHAFYLESGFEEANAITFNLCAHVHPIGTVYYHGQVSSNID